MDSKFVVKEALLEGERLYQEFNHFLPVRCAFWILPDSEDAHWSLNIASDDLDDSNKPAAYAELSRLIHEVPLPHLLFVSTRLVRGSERIVRDVINVRMPFGGKEPLRCPVSRLGGVEIAEAFIYPLPDSVPRIAEKVTVFSEEEQGIIDQLASHGIRVSVRRLGEQYYSCRARYDADNRDSQVTYGESVIEVLQRIASNIRHVWSELFATSTPS